jgi:ParB family transcriptional regulator, chromosome partitioning protein
MAELMESLRARGQQAPVEVVDRGEGAVPRYGLISGWRRLLALQALLRETGEDRFTRVLALVRRPEGGAEAYVAMVEENEIRAGLSFYERARIVMRAVEAGVYPTEKAALQGLFATASFAKRSKVKSFIGVVEALDGALAFPARIPERTGLALAKALAADPGFGPRARAALSPPAPSPEAEALVLAGLLRKPSAAGKRDEAETESGKTVSVQSDLAVTARAGEIVISGAGATPALAERLMRWLAAQSRG